MSQDNPIYRTLTDVLGLGRPPSTFQEKASAIEILTSGKTSSYRDILRKQDASDIIEGSKVAFGKNIDFMFEKLHKSGLLPEEARSVFERIKSVGGQIGFNERTNALFLYTRGEASFLPTANAFGGIDIGGSSRKVNSLLVSYRGTSPFETRNYLGAYYGTAERVIADQIDSFGDNAYLSLPRAIKKVRGTKLAALNGPVPINDLRIGSITLSSTLSRGLSTPFEQGYVSSLYAPIGYSDDAMSFADSLSRYRSATSAFSMLAKTGGRSVFKELSPKENITSSEALELINQYRTDYLHSALPKFLTQLGVQDSYLYGKADFLGNKKKFLVAGQELGRKFGTFVEEHTAKKGLHQLAKMVGGNSLSEPTPFVLKGGDVLQDQMLRVAVVDLENEKYSRLLFGEGGAYMTAQGANKLAFRAPVGTMKITSPETSTTQAIEALFGVNLAKGSQQVDVMPKFTRADVVAAIKGKDLTDTQKFIRKILGPKGYNKGLLLQITNGDNTLNQIKMSPDKIELSFLTANNVVPETIETVVGARRFTGGKLRQSALKEIAGQLNVDYVIAADEFSKTHGQDVLTSNFIHQLRQQPQAEALLKDTFGNNLIKKVQGSKTYYTPEVIDANTAFLQATKKLNEWKNSDQLSLRLLANRIEFGEQASIGIKGVKGIRIFGMRGGRRADFMGDINMMKGVRMTLSKMQILANSSRLLGYSSEYDDPVFSGLTAGHSVWSKGLIRLRRGSGQLTLSRNHTLHRFASALLGKANPDADSLVIKFNNGRFELNGQALDRLPAIGDFSHGAGGVHKDRLKNTILGLNTDLAYLDLGESRSIHILGKSRDLRYLPIPLQYLRATPGSHGYVSVDKSHTGHEFLKSLIELEGGRPFDQSSPLLYTNIVKSLMGRDGVFAKTNTLHLKFATRARIAPDFLNAFSSEDLLDPSKFYTSVMSEEAFDDWITRKAGVASEMKGKGVNRRPTLHKVNRDATINAMRNRGYIYAMIGVDPAQRGEHMMLQKVRIKKSGTRSLFGQINIILNPLYHRSVERDIDRDVVNLTSMEGLADEAALEERFQRQTKRISPFVKYYHRQLESAPGTSSIGRLSNVLTKPFVRALDYIEDFIGVPKSLGYSMVRASDEIMANISAYGLKGAKDMGLLGRLPTDVLDNIVSRFSGNLEKTSVIQHLMQSMYQGAVQKGHGKAGLIGLAEGLINLGQKYKNQNFDLNIVEQEGADLFETFLKNEKGRTFMALDWMRDSGMLDKRTTDLLLGDLTRASAEELAQAEARLVRKTAELLGSYVGVGAVLSSSVEKQRSTVRSVLHKTISDNTTDEELDTLMHGIVGSDPDVPKNKFTSVLESEVKKQEKLAGSKYLKAKKLVKEHKFLAGLGVGAVLGGSLVALMSGPSMPRDIDVRQPEDYGPDPIYSSTPPRIYGTNQAFTASRRRDNNRLSNVSPYRMSSSGSSNITIREKSASNNPYLLERQMREISNSDYTY